MPRISPRRLPATTTTRAQNSRWMPLTCPGFRFPQRVRPAAARRPRRRWRSRKWPIADARCARYCWETMVEVEAVKTPRLGPVVGRGRAHQDLGQKQQGDDQKELDGSLLAGTGPPREHLGMGRGGGPLPAQIVEFAEGKKNGRGPGQQGDQAQGAPQVDRGRGRRVARQGIIGEIVGVGVDHDRGDGPPKPRRSRQKRPSVAAVPGDCRYIWSSSRRFFRDGRNNRSIVRSAADRKRLPVQ